MREEGGGVHINKELVIEEIMKEKGHKASISIKSEMGQQNDCLLRSVFKSEISLSIGF